MFKKVQEGKKKVKKRFNEVQEGLKATYVRSRRFKMVQECSRTFNNVQVGSIMLRNVQESSRRFRKVQEESRRPKEV